MADTINDKLQYLEQTKQLIKQAIISKGVNVSDQDTFRSYANKISSIEQSAVEDLSHSYFQIMPAMTSDSAPSGYSVTSSGDYSGFPAYKAFSKTMDMNCGQRWLSAKVSEWRPQWIAIQLPEAKQISAYRIFFAYKGGFVGEEGRNPKSWRLEGKNSTGGWITIDTRENEPQSTYYHDLRMYVLNEKVSYSNYRLYVTEAQEPESTYGHGVHILMLELLDNN